MPVVFVMVCKGWLKIARAHVVHNWALLRRLLAIGVLHRSRLSLRLLLVTVRRADSEITVVKSLHFSLQDISIAHLHLRWSRHLLLHLVVSHVFLMELGSVTNIIPLLPRPLVGVWHCVHLALELIIWHLVRCLLHVVTRGWKGRPAEKCCVLDLEVAARLA